MRALTLTQPWCGLVASGIKLIENRPRSMVKREDFGKPFALHASREIDDAVYDRIAEIAPELFDLPGVDDTALRLSVGAPRSTPSTRLAATPWYRLSRITSSVIGVATIECVIEPDKRSPTGWCRSRHRGGWSQWLDETRPGQRRWFFGPVGYVLRDIRALATPVPCRGHQGFWTLSPEVAARVSSQLEEP